MNATSLPPAKAGLANHQLTSLRLRDAGERRQFAAIFGQEGARQHLISDFLDLAERRQVREHESEAMSDGP